MNYFNYFTEIEQHFQRQRGAQVLLSPVDWALIESWREAAIPLAAVLAGIDRAFEKFASGRRTDHARLRSLVYCAPAVLDAAEAMRAAELGAPAAGGPTAAADEGFSAARVIAHLRHAQRALEASPVAPAAIAAAVDRLAASLEAGAPAYGTPGGAAPGPAPDVDPESLDRTLSVLDDQLFAALQQATPLEVMVSLRSALDRDLAGYRRQLRPEQITMIARQFEQRRLLEHHRLPRLSLFYMD